MVNPVVARRSIRGTHVPRSPGNYWNHCIRSRSFPLSKSLNVADVFRENGLIARRLPGYESRPQQVEMATAVAQAIAEGEHLVVEAGTGVGKSFGYLIPCILAASQRSSNERKRTRIVISTHTISLQEQIISRDIPFLNAVIPTEFTAVLVKGRNNYISLRRLKGAWEKSGSLFESEQQSQLQTIRNWAEKSGDGSLADLGFSPRGEVWDEIRSEHGNCLGKKCPEYKDCFYYRARRRVWNADILVVNHALFYSDLALRREGASVLPDYDVAVFDEAHTLEDVAASHMGMTVTSGQFTFLFNKLYNDRGTAKGLFIAHNFVDGQKLVAHLRIRVDRLFDRIDQWREMHGTSNGRVHRPIDVENDVSGELHELATMIREFTKPIPSEERKIELNAQADRLDVLGVSLSAWLKQRDEESVYWIEKTSSRFPVTKLMSSPVDIGTVLREDLFNEVPSVILTSATLSVGKQDFSFYRNRIGLTKSRELKLGSPFDYQKQTELILADGMPDPSESPVQYEQAVAERIPEYLAKSEGGAFVLFTSYRMLRNSASRLTQWCTEQGRLLLSQGDGMQRTTLLEKFRKDGRAVLFGTETFWQGVDVPGDALKTVIITKLPFSVPDHPLLQARLERIRANGGNPFMEYQVPEAAIKLRQGFGRLIRTATDTGRVIILDPRIRTKRYGRLFLDSLPDCRRTVRG
jgi:ATP-dependent DNA helicase DinG